MFVSSSIMPGGVSLSSASSHLLARSVTCETQVCKDTASAILHDLDLNVDPCSDFYQYTCANWIKDSHIPDSESAVGTFSDLRNENSDRLSAILDGSYEDIYQFLQSKGGDQSFLPNEQVDKDRENFNKIKAFYRSCMDEDTINSLGPTPLYPEIATILSKLGYNADYVDGFFTNDNLRQFTDTLIYLTEQGTGHLISSGVGADDQAPDENVISLNQPSLGLPTREYYEQPQVIEEYRKGLVQLLTAVLGEPTGENPVDNLRRQKLGEINYTPLSSIDVEAMVDRFIDFETHLAKITLPIEELRDPITQYNPMSLADLHQKYPIVDWIQFFRHFTPKEVSLPEKIIVTTPRFFQDLTEWFVNSAQREDGITTQHLREFFTIKTILENTDSVDSATREIYRAMVSKIASGTTAPPLRNRVCISDTANAFGQLLGRYFVIKHFGGEEQREQVAQFMDNIQSSWLSRLNVVDWLDSETTSRAVEKVNKINHKQAYSIVTPDVRSPESLGAYYGDINIDVLNFYGNQESIHRWLTRREWDKVGKKVDKQKWYMDPQDVNAYYSPNMNEIVIPAGILQPPFYKSGVPEYLNYGGIGVVIGHEITHAFDDSGRLYDGDGVLNSWWTNTTSEAFDQKTQCFVNQYSRFSVAGPNNATYNVNGKMTLGENLADSGGLNAALGAMKKSLEEDPGKNLALPRLESLSPEQLFFINFARVWCSNMRPEMAVQRVHNDVHSPAQVRVNAAVQNMPEFAKAFKCGTQQKPMNPSDKCQIW